MNLHGGNSKKALYAHISWNNYSMERWARKKESIDKLPAYLWGKVPVPLTVAVHVFYTKKNPTKSPESLGWCPRHLLKMWVLSSLQEQKALIQRWAQPMRPWLEGSIAAGAVLQGPLPVLMPHNSSPKVGELSQMVCTRQAQRRVWGSQGDQHSPT